MILTYCRHRVGHWSDEPRRLRARRLTSASQATTERDKSVALKPDNFRLSSDSFSGRRGRCRRLERLGKGVIITYRLSAILNEDGDCDVRVQATVRLDTRSDTITAPLRLKSLCSIERQGLLVTGTN